MKPDTENRDYDPASYDLHFDFDVDLKFGPSDYVILGFYLLFVFPFIFFTGVVKKLFGRSSSKSSKKEPIFTTPIRGTMSLISKIF